MTTITIDGLGSYQNAMDCKAELKHHGVEANITTGGLTVWAEDKDVETEGTAINQLKLVKIVVASFGGRVCENGRTALAERIARKWEG